MNRMMLFAAAAAAALMISPVMAQTAPPPADVTVSISAKLPNLKEPKVENTFLGRITDAQLREVVTLKCTAGRSKWAFFHENKVCGFQQGSAVEINVNNTWYPRVLIGGYYEVTQSGSTDGAKLTYAYQPVGKVAGSNSTYTGELMLKPELSSGGAKGLVDDVLAGIKSKEGGGVINTETDTISFNNFCVPSGGFPSDKGTCFNGDGVYSYQSYSWFFRLTAKFADKIYKLEGNMPFTSPIVPENTNPDKPSITEYNVTLTDPDDVSAATTGGDEDAALFAEFDADAGFGASPKGITGKLTMNNAGYVDVQIGSETIPVASGVELTGTLHGNEVPLPVVRAFAKILVEVLPETFVGP